MDFVIPLHCMNPMFRSTIEAVSKLYSPEHIYIITPLCEIEKIVLSEWKMDNTFIHCISEELFFEPISKSDLEMMYTKKDENSREFGWWYQQILKMGAARQIVNLSDPYMVWDSDLIPIKRWEIYPTEEFPYHRFAILQKEARSEWNESQYEKSILKLIGMKTAAPEEGTFVPHHFIMYKSVLEELFEHIERGFTSLCTYKSPTKSENISNKDDCYHALEKCEGLNPWFMTIIQLSSEFWRFSEYKCIATFMTEKKPDLLKYHTFDKYGNGFRFRDSKAIFDEIMEFVETNDILYVSDVPYERLLEFVYKKWEDVPTYIQLEHL